MPNNKRYILAVDDSVASRRAVSYVATVLAGRADVSVRLLHVLPELPPHLLEWGGTANPDDEEWLLAEGQADFVAAAERTAQPMVDEARRMLTKAGIPDHAIETQLYPSVATADIVDDILEVARDENCGTVIVGRESWPHLRETFQTHICHKLIKKAHGLTVWVVE
jgi:nucleotide-binding universal stress UspA family protein